ncbi:MAG: SDR family NAD(P)-dependent oxidoreductase [Verrucomicrobiota bacterium]|jgi:nucleoside-diphosphate-sugar epimerase|nr:SDR family NAD(P)-dependent oxidoreductase [Verrucomicrobiota bacterium]
MDFWKKRNVLVTGGCGFLGSYLTEELVAAGANVTVADNLEAGSLANIAAVAEQVRFVQADLMSPDACRAVSEGADVIMNLAGRVRGVGYSSAHPGEMLYRNTLLALNMLEAARLSGVPRFLAVSSSCVYPDNAAAPIPESASETGLPESSNLGYGWAKRVTELQAQYYHQEYGIETAIVRPTNACGARYPWRGEHDSFVMPTLVKKVLDGADPLVVWGDGQQRRNFLHASDIARIFMLVTERYACAKPVNVGYEQDTSIAELVRLICAVTQRSPRIVYDTSKPSGCLRKCVDATLLRQVTGGYEPRVTLEQTLQEMIGWYHATFPR